MANLWHLLWLSVNNFSLKFTSNEISTQLQLSELPPDSEPWWNPSYPPPESDTRYSEPQQYPHPYRHASQSSRYSSADLSGCSRPDDCHSLSQSRDFQGNITYNFFIFNSPVHQNTAPSTPFSGEHDELEELHTVCLGIELRWTFIWELNSEQLIIHFFWYDFIVLLTGLHTVSPLDCIWTSKLWKKTKWVAMLIICWLM